MRVVIINIANCKSKIGKFPGICGWFTDYDYNNFFETYNYNNLNM